MPERPITGITMVSQTNIDRKAAKVAAVKEQLDNSQLVFAAPLDGLSVADMYQLRQKVPKTTKVMTVKNTLMRRAIAESDWEGLGDFTTQSNIWFFVGEDVKGTVQAYEKFVVGELKKQPVKGGMMEGVVYDSEGIDTVSALPSRIELITKIAVLIKMVPTKVGRAVHAVPSKLARAVKLAVADEDGDAPAEPAQ